MARPNGPGRLSRELRSGERSPRVHLFVDLRWSQVPRRKPLSLPSPSPRDCREFGLLRRPSETVLVGSVRPADRAASPDKPAIVSSSTGGFFREARSRSDAAGEAKYCTLLNTRRVWTELITRSGNERSFMPLRLRRDLFARSHGPRLVPHEKFTDSSADKPSTRACGRLPTTFQPFANELRTCTTSFLCHGENYTVSLTYRYVADSKT